MQRAGPPDFRGAALPLPPEKCTAPETSPPEDKESGWAAPEEEKKAPEGEQRVMEAALRASEEALEDAIADAEELLEGWLTRPHPRGAVAPLMNTTEGMTQHYNVPLMHHKIASLLLNLVGITPGCPVVAINSNEGGMAQPGFEYLIKKAAPAPALAPAGRRNRMPEGKGTSFGSAIEPIFQLVPGSPIEKRVRERLQSLKQKKGNVSPRLYRSMYFAASGSLQVRGVVLPDEADGHWATNAWLDFLNEPVGPGGSPRLGGAATLQGPRIIDLANFRFTIRRISSRQILNAEALIDRLQAEDNPLGYPVLVATRETSRAQVNLDCEGKKPAVKFFLMSGKVNFLGFPSREVAERVHAMLGRLLEEEWNSLVSIRPLKDEATAELLEEFATLLEATSGLLPPGCGPAEEEAALPAEELEVEG